MKRQGLGLGTSGSACQWHLSQVKEESPPEIVATASWLVCFGKLVQAVFLSLYRLQYKANTGFHLDLLRINIHFWDNMGQVGTCKGL